MKYWFHVLSIMSAVSAIIELAFWITSHVEGRPFQGGWRLLSSIVWAAIFFYLSRRRTNSK